MIVNAGYRGKVGAGAPKFTYTGTYNIRKDGVVELLTSGTIVFLEPKVIDVFMVGGGGKGGEPEYNDTPDKAGYGGGGGGYTKTVRRKAISANQPITVTVGAGGTTTAGGGASAFGTETVSGGSTPSGSASSRKTGGAGGSGGGGGATSKSDGGVGGYDGNSGEGSSSGGGGGQGYTTREFGEVTGKLYAGGGGGGRWISAQSAVVSMGGTGGGGTGSWAKSPNGDTQEAAAGVANTGGGGGGGGRYTNGTWKALSGASGGSGIVCFREAQELPELAGTWVLNERLYAPESTLTFSGTFIWGTQPDCTRMEVNPTSYLYVTRGGTQYAKYQFSTNTWQETTRTVIFPTGATASDEFRAWLASNATKQ